MSGDPRRDRSPSGCPIKPPKTADRLLALIVSEQDLDFVSGDLAEIFEAAILPAYGPARAKLWYWKQVVLSTGFFLICRMRSQSPLPAWKGRVNIMKTPNQGVESHPGIRIDKIPVHGAMGLLFMFATLFIFGAGIRAVRSLFLIAAVFGILGSFLLYFWHKRHAVKIRALSLHENGDSEAAMDQANQVKPPAQS